MSRSYRKPIYKDKGLKKIYYRLVRAFNKQQINRILSGKSEIIENHKAHINDWDYSDYTLDWRQDDNNSIYKIKYSRK